jgi:hypothetical protein
MPRSVNRDLWDQWRQRIERQRQSGLSVAEFCRREGIPSHGFHVWKRKLNNASSARPRSRESAAARRSRKRAAGMTPRRQSHDALATGAAVVRPSVG